MITIDDVRAALTQRLAIESIPMSPEVMSMALADVDLAAERAQLEPRYTWRVWTGAAPFVGLPDAPEGSAAIYAILVDGKPLVLQTFLPGAAGQVPMDAAEATSRAQQQVEQLIDRTLLMSVVDGIVSRWKAASGATGTAPGTGNVVLPRFARMTQLGTRQRRTDGGN